MTVADSPYPDPRLAVAGARDLVEHAVRKAGPSADVLIYRDLARRAVDALVAHDLDPAAAARSFAAESRRLGAQRAQQRADETQVARDLAAIGREVQLRVLPSVAGSTRLDGRELRARLGEYLRRILQDVVYGLRRAERLLSTPHEQRVVELLRSITVREDAEATLLLAQSCGLDTAATYRPVLARGGGRWSRPFDADPDVVAAPEQRTVLVPGGWSVRRVHAAAGRPVAVGPAVALTRLPEAVRLTRLAARSRGTDAPVQVETMLSELVVAPDGLLGEMLVEARLGPLNDLPVSRRVRIGTTLLAWLQSGRPLNEVARTLGHPPQTVHSQIAVARKLLGEDLNDPERRLELILALRIALPRWRAEAGPTG